MAVFLQMMRKMSWVVLDAFYLHFVNCFQGLIYLATHSEIPG